MFIRLNRYLAMAGLGSRRKVEEFITAGQVSVNNQVITDLSLKVEDGKDVVSLAGKPVQLPRKFIYLLLNKPRGYVVTRSDEYKRKTIYQLLPDFAQQCSPAGRLDLDTEGLLLLTNDGAVVQALTHPTRKVTKIYKVEIEQPLTPGQLHALREGVQIEGYLTKPAGIFVKSTKMGRVSLKIAIQEGRKRQIRLMLQAVGSQVISLKRLQIGELELGKLPIGMWRLCSKQEVDYMSKLKGVK